MLQKLKASESTLFPFFWQLYEGKSHLYYGDKVLTDEQRMRQGGH